MAKVYKSICNEIDKMYLEVLHLTEKSITYKLQVEKVINLGFVNIAKARYIMGNKAVSSMQLPTENSNKMQALATVCRAEHKNHWVFKIHREDPNLKKKGSSDSGESLSFGISKALLTTGMSELRKRRDVAVIDDDRFKSLNDDLLDNLSDCNNGDNEVSDISLGSLIDPIRLFGVLVPNTLRTAQQKFIEVLDLLSKCATLQSEINMALKRHKHLLKIKFLIEQSVKGRTVDIYEDKEYWEMSVSSTASSYSDVNEPVMYCPEEEEEEVCDITPFEETELHHLTFEMTDVDAPAGTDSEGAGKKDEKKKVSFTERNSDDSFAVESLTSAESNEKENN